MEPCNQQSNQQKSLRYLSSNLAEVTLSDAVNTFLEVALASRSDDTVRWYRLRLGSLVQYLGDIKLISVMGVDLDDWYADLSRRSHRYGCASLRPVEEGGLSRSTLNGYVRAVRRFFRWLKKRRLVDEYIAADLELPSLPAIAKYGIRDEDAKRMLVAARDHPRDYAILQFFAATGCRLEGACNLTLSDIAPFSNDEDLRHRVMLHEKFTKDREAFLTDEALGAMISWLAVRPGSSRSCAVFVGRSNREAIWHSLTPGSVYERFALYASKAGVKSNWSPHQWRHRFGRKLAQDDVNLGVICQLMGHENVDVTVRHYGKFAVKQLQEIYRNHQGVLSIRD